MPRCARWIKASAWAHQSPGNSIAAEQSRRERPRLHFPQKSEGPCPVPDTTSRFCDFTGSRIFRARILGKKDKVKTRFASELFSLFTEPPTPPKNFFPWRSMPTCVFLRRQRAARVPSSPAWIERSARPLSIQPVRPFVNYDPARAPIRVFAFRPNGR